MIEPGSRFFASAAVCVSTGSWSTLASWPSYRRVRSTSIGELQRIAVDSSDGRSSGQSWGTFLRNHLPQIACRAIHSVVGCPVTSIQTSSSRASQTMTRTYSRLKPMVGTTKRSMAAICGRWLRRKVPQRGWSDLDHDTQLPSPVSSKTRSMPTIVRPETVLRRAASELPVSAMPQPSGRVSTGCSVFQVLSRRQLYPKHRRRTSPGGKPGCRQHLPNSCKPVSVACASAC